MIGDAGARRELLVDERHHEPAILPCQYFQFRIERGENAPAGLLRKQRVAHFDAADLAHRGIADEIDPVSALTQRARDLSELVPRGLITPEHVNFVRASVAPARAVAPRVLKNPCAAALAAGIALIRPQIRGVYVHATPINPALERGELAARVDAAKELRVSLFAARHGASRDADSGHVVTVPRLVACSTTETRQKLSGAIRAATPKKDSTNPNISISLDAVDPAEEQRRLNREAQRRWYYRNGGRVQDDHRRALVRAAVARYAAKKKAEREKLMQ